MKPKKIGVVLLLISVLGVEVYSQQRGTPKQIRVLIDSLGNLVTAAQAATPPYTSVTFANARLLVDSSGALVVTETGGGGLSDAFTSVPVSGQTTITASGATALTVAAGSNITLTTNNTTKTLTIAASGGTITCADTRVLFSDGANNPSCDSGLTYDKTLDGLTVGTSTPTGWVLIGTDAAFIGGTPNPESLFIGKATYTGGADIFFFPTSSTDPFKYEWFSTFFRFNPNADGLFATGHSFQTGLLGTHHGTSLSNIYAGYNDTNVNAVQMDTAYNLDLFMYLRNTTTTAYNVFVDAPSVAGTTAVTNMYGLYVANQEAAGITTSYAIYTNNGAVRLGDDVTITGFVQPGSYKSSDGTVGVTVSACTGFKNGLCISGT